MLLLNSLGCIVAKPSSYCGIKSNCAGVNTRRQNGQIMKTCQSTPSIHEGSGQFDSSPSLRRPLHRHSFNHHASRYWVFNRWFPIVATRIHCCERGFSSCQIYFCVGEISCKKQQKETRAAINRRMIFGNDIIIYSSATTCNSRSE